MRPSLLRSGLSPQVQTWMFDQHSEIRAQLLSGEECLDSIVKKLIKVSIDGLIVAFSNRDQDGVFYGLKSRRHIGVGAVLGVEDIIKPSLLQISRNRFNRLRIHAEQWSDHAGTTFPFVDHYLKFSL
jgi:hypothetical protein